MCNSLFVRLKNNYIRTYVNINMHNVQLYFAEGVHHINLHIYFILNILFYIKISLC